MTPDARIQAEADQLEARWRDDPRWSGVERTYGATDVVRLRGSVVAEHTLARNGAERLWELLQREEPVRALGAMTGGQAVQMVKAGLEAIYLSGWQVAADANAGGATYPDQSLYPANSAPQLVKRLNNALQRADQIDWSEGRNGTHWYAPIVADAEAGFGGPLNAYELMRSMIEAGAAGVHYEDQLASEKKCGHLGGKVLVPTAQFVRTLNAARLAADVLDVPTLLVARTDALVGGAPDERHRRVRPRVRDRRAHGGGLLPRARRDRRGDRARARVCAVRRPDLVRDLDARHRRGEGVRRRDPREVPGQAARVQLLAVVQLAQASRRRDDRELPAAARRVGLQVPVHHARGLPLAERGDVRAREGLCRRLDDARTSSCRSTSSRSRSRATRRRGISARSAPATSTSSRRPCRPTARRSRSRARRKRRSSRPSR